MDSEKEIALLTRDLWPRERGVAPIRVLQLGEGRFLRTFVDALFQELGRKGPAFSVLMTNMRASGAATIEGLQRQDGLYTVVFGDEEKIERTVIDCVMPVELKRQWSTLVEAIKTPDLTVIVTNGTEASYRAPVEESWPVPPGDGLVSRLVLLLWERWQVIPESPLWVMPTELVTHNGARLRQLVIEASARFQAAPAFQRWLQEKVRFVNSWVDRIVAGYPESARSWWDAWGYRDAYCSIAERYGRWWIERASWEPQGPLPLDRLPEVCLVDDLAPYEDLKLFLLNGAHIGLAALGLLRGYATVAQAMSDPDIAQVVNNYWRCAKGVVPLPAQEVDAFIRHLPGRFQNPYIAHQLRDIASNLAQKWRLRLQPVIWRIWEREQRIPQPLVTFTAAIGQWLALNRESANSASTPTLKQLLGLDSEEGPWLDALCAAVHLDE